MKHIPLILFISIKCALLIAYIYTVVFMWQFSISPLIALYGAWTFWSTIAFMSFCGFILSFAFFWMPRPHKPQATLKSPSWSTPKDYQDYLTTSPFKPSSTTTNSTTPTNSKPCANTSPKPHSKLAKNTSMLELVGFIAVMYLAYKYIEHEQNKHNGE